MICEGAAPIYPKAQSCDNLVQGVHLLLFKPNPAHLWVGHQLCPCLLHIIYRPSEYHQVIARQYGKSKYASVISATDRECDTTVGKNCSGIGLDMGYNVISRWVHRVGAEGAKAGEEQ